MKSGLKELMKKKAFVGGTAVALTLIISVTAVILLAGKEPAEAPKAEPESSDISANIPEISVPTDENSTVAEENAPSDLVVDVVSNNQNTNDNKNKSDKAKDPEKPVVPKAPVQTTNPNNGGEINIGGGGNSEKYNCNTPNHHCQSAGFHTGLINRELEGCNMCGSHSCPGFYDINEWGFTKYNMKLCPKYNEKSDPTKYCQKCGREIWSKDNPTGCFRFLQPTDCECGQHVDGNTCHHH